MLQRLVQCYHCLCFSYLGGFPEEPEISSSNGWMMHLPPSSPHIPLCPSWCSAQGKWQSNWTKLWIYLQSFWCVSLPDMCIATAISLLMILICAMATYGAYKVIYFVQWRYNSVESKLRQLLSNNLLFRCLAENWEKKKKNRDSRTACIDQCYPRALHCRQEGCPLVLTVCSFKYTWALGKLQIQRTETCSYQS